MFYVKEKINDAAELRIEITDENVFCHCPGCGNETGVILHEILKDEDTDLFGTEVYCDDCSKIMTKGGCCYGHQ